jgi:hypothetical protein
MTKFVLNTSILSSKIIKKLYQVITSSHSFARGVIFDWPKRKLKSRLKRKILILNMILLSVRPKIYRKDIGLTNRTNFIIGFSSYITDILSWSICVEQTKFLRVWPISSEHARPNSAVVITKKCKRNTILFIKFYPNLEQIPTEL